MSLIVVQNINRRNGKRRTLQIGEIMHDGDAKTLMQLNAAKDTLEKISEPTTLYETLNLYTGLSKEEIEKHMEEKIDILKWMVSSDINDINKIGLIMSKYYRKQPFRNVAK